MKKGILLFTSFLIGFVAGGVNGQTYTDEVANIINENCVVCHRAGGIGPMSFETYEQIRPWAPLISLKVASREMPHTLTIMVLVFKICKVIGV